MKGEGELMMINHPDKILNIFSAICLIAMLVLVVMTARVRIKMYKLLDDFDKKDKEKENVNPN